MEATGRLMEGLEHWLEQSTKPLYASSKYKNQVDPITWMNRNIWLNDEYKPKAADSTGVQQILDVYLYCIDRYMKGLTMSNKPNVYGYFKKFMDGVDYKAKELV